MNKKKKKKCVCVCGGGGGVGGFERPEKARIRHYHALNGMFYSSHASSMWTKKTLRRPNIKFLPKLNKDCSY